MNTSRSTDGVRHSERTEFPWVNCARLACLAAVVYCFVGACGLISGAQKKGERAKGQPGEIAWLVGEQLVDALDLPCTISCSETPFREILEGFSRRQKIAILLDRRIDPDQKVSLSIRGKPVRTALGEMAAAAGGHVSFVEDTVFIAPRQPASSARTLSVLQRDEMNKAPKELRGKLTAKGRLSWDHFSEPVAIVEKLAKSAGLKLENPEAIAHDLWNEADLPQMSWSARITLVLHQFDLTFELHPKVKSLRLIPVMPDPILERRFAAGSSPESRLQELQGVAPRAEFKLNGAWIVARGRAEDLDLIPRPNETLPKNVKKTKVLSEELATLHIKDKPLLPVLRELAKQLQFELKIDEQKIKAAGIKLDQLVSIDLSEVKVSGLIDAALTAVLKETGLTYRREENTIEVIVSQ